MSIFSRHLIDASHMWAPLTQWDVVSCNTDWPAVLYLFTASDIKTMIFPVTSFAIVAGPFSSWIGLVSTVAWIWIHLLQFNVSNQCGGVEEDTLNKPWRPIPAGHISLSSARRLRWNAAILGLVFSSMFSSVVAWISIVITAATWIYNEAHLSSHWLGKTSCNVVGYVSFQAGAALVMSGNEHLDDVALYSLMWSAIAIFFTVQAQDFPDVEGDAAMGRKTLPIVWPVASRLLTMGTILGCSWAATAFWAVGSIAQALCMLCGCTIAVRYACYHGYQQDKRTYVLYNVWLMIIVLLPAHARWQIFSV